MVAAGHKSIENRRLIASDERAESCEQSLSGEPETTFLEDHKLRLAAAPTRVAIEKAEFGDQVVRRMLIV